MKDPIVVKPEGFDLKAAWSECREWVDNHEPGSIAGAAGADPGCNTCPVCREYYWSWGRVQRCRRCYFVYPTDWLQQYIDGCRDGLRHKQGAEVSGGVQRRFASDYYRYGFHHPVENFHDEAKAIVWRSIGTGDPDAMPRKHTYCERCGKDKEGSRARSSQICVQCEAETLCRHEKRTGPWSLDIVCEAGVRLGDLTGDQPGWGLKIPCRYMPGGCPVECPEFAPTEVSVIEEDDAATDEAIAIHMAVMPLVAKVKRDRKGENWKGVETCPICQGRLHLSHAAYNSHVWGKCETENCLSWIE